MSLKRNLSRHGRGRPGGCVKFHPLPVAEIRMQKVAKDACISTFQSVKHYDHGQAQKWSTQVMDQILAELAPDGKVLHRPRKFVVTCSIIQYTVPIPIAQTTSASAGQESVSANNFYSASRLWSPIYNLSLSMRRGLLGPAAVARGEFPVGDEGTAEEYGDVAWNPSTKMAVLPSWRLPRPVDDGPNTTVGRAGRYFAAKALWTHNRDGIWECTWEGGSERDFDVIICLIHIGFEKRS